MNSIIDPIAFSLYGLKVRWYGLAYIATFLISVYLAKRAAKAQNPVYFSAGEIDKLSNYIILGVIAGGRIGEFVFYRPEQLFTLELFKIRNGGMSFHGGVWGVAIAMLLYSFIYKKNYFKISDIVSMFVPIGSFLGRIANYINGEIIGRKTKLLAPLFDQHPVVFYEAFLEGLLLFFILYRYKSLRKTGSITSKFLFFYGLFRFFTEFLRTPDGMLFFLTTAQCLSIIMMMLGAFVYIKKR